MTRYKLARNGILLAFFFASIVAAEHREFGLGGIQDLQEQEGSTPTSDREREHPSGWPKLGENLRLALDLSSRVSLNTRTGKAAAEQFLGIDMLAVLSREEGDWGTLTLQGYTARLDNQQARPPFFDDDDDWEFVFRIFNFNYTQLAQGKFNIRVGHFEIPYGLEQTINTNGTLRQYTHGRNIGVKADWGVTINGELDAFEYELGLSRGTGNEFFDRGSPYIFAGRIGTPREQNFVFGASAMYGRVYNPGAAVIWASGVAPPPPGIAGTARARAEARSDSRGDNGVLRRSRFGLDMQWFNGLWGVFAEASVGRDYNQDVINGLLEINWENPAGTWLLYGQGTVAAQRFSRGWESDVNSILGARFAPDSHWAFSAQYTQDIVNFDNASRGAVLALQVRYRFH